MRKRKIEKSHYGSAYWYYVFNKPSYYAGDGGAQEEIEANPDQLSEEDTLISKSELTDEQEDNLATYYRLVSSGILKKLTSRQREIWKLRFFKWCSDEEISQQLNISLSAVRTHIARAAGKIKIEIEKQTETRGAV